MAKKAREWSDKMNQYETLLVQTVLFWFTYVVVVVCDTHTQIKIGTFKVYIRLTFQDSLLLQNYESCFSQKKEKSIWYTQG